MTKQPTIAFVIGGLTAGGAERVITTLANHLSDSYRVVMITLNKEEPFYKLNPSIQLVHCNDFYNPSLNIFQAISANFHILLKITRFIKYYDIAVLIGFTTYVNILTVIAARRSNIRCIISERNNPNKVPLRKVWRFLRKKFYNKADYLVVQTIEIAEFYYSSVELDKIKIIANPISQELIDSRETFEVRKNVVLTVGRLTEQKAQDRIIKAFAAVNPGDWNLRIIGKGVKETGYRKLIKSLQLEDKVEILSPTDNIAHHYKTSSIFALTSNFEGFPNALIEAMYFGLPCISTNCPTGPSNLISDGINGFLISLNDQKSLEESLKALMDSKELRENFGKEGASSVNRYEVSIIIQQWQYLIDNLR